MTTQRRVSATFACRDSINRSRIACKLLGLLPLAAAAVWIIAVRLHTAEEPLERDIVTMILHGRSLNAGAQLYVDVLEFKPPGAMMLWQGVDRLVGTGRMVVLTLNIAASLLTLVCIHRFTIHFTRSHFAGGCAAILWTLLSGDLYLQANHPNLEVFINTAMAAGLAIWISACRLHRKWGIPEAIPYILAGVCFFAATFLKHHVIIIFAGMLLFGLLGGMGKELIRRRGLNNLACVAAGFALPWILCITYFRLAGRLDEFIALTVTIARRYGTTRGLAAPEPNASLLQNLVEGLEWDRLIPQSMSALLMVALPTVIALLAAIIGRQTRRRALLLLGWLIGTFIVVSLPGTFFAHYYQHWILPLTVGAAWGLAMLRRRSQSAAMVVASLLLATLALHEGLQLAKSPTQWSEEKYGIIFTEVERLSSAVDACLMPEESLYVWGIDPGFYFNTGRKPPTPILWNYWPLYGGPYAEEWSDRILSDLESVQPDLLVRQRANTPTNPITDWLDANYVSIKLPAESPLFTFAARRGSALARRFATQQSRWDQSAATAESVEGLPQPLTPSTIPGSGQSARD